ncbi:MAG: DUF3455 domain-containing protein, partial [Ramlibacter sp.]
VTVAAIASAGVLLSACAGAPMAEAAAAPEVPPAIRAADGERLSFIWHATGSQVYECRADAKGAMAWAFVAPEADLFDSRGEKVGTHGAGPHWAALDGSKTIGTVKARAPGEGAADIPWLLLAAKAQGAGRMAAVTSVQRIHTRGGNPLPAGCAQVADTGKSLKQPYTADYVFFVAK